jgi:hypothetical protein
MQFRPYARFAVSAILFVLPVSFAADSPSVRRPEAFAGDDIGARINAAYADLPSAGGMILLSEGGSYSTPIVFGTNNKPVLLVGLPGDIVTLSYTGSGTAITFDPGTGHRMGHGLRDLTISGPGHDTSTVGIRFGGENGAEGIAFRDSRSRVSAPICKWAHTRGSSTSTTA